MDSLDDYQLAARRTAVRPENREAAAYQLSGFGLGIAGEAGEVADYLKKVLHHGHPMDVDRLREELGDVLWYTALIAERAGIYLSEVAEANIRKLERRYPDGWTSEDSIERVDHGTE